MGIRSDVASLSITWGRITQIDEEMTYYNLSFGIILVWLAAKTCMKAYFLTHLY
jgi:hypothetical protein